MSNEDMKQSAQDVVLSLTGYDEIAIEKAFGMDLESLPAQKSMRALAFVLFRRKGQTDAEAKESVLQASQQAVMEMFGVDLEELMADEPETEQGKGDALSEPAPPA